MKLRKVYPIILTAVITLLIGFAFVAFLLRPQPLDIGTVDLNTVSDGEYIGFCQNKILFAVVKVDVQDHKIIAIEVLEHKPSYMEQAVRVLSSAAVSLRMMGTRAARASCSMRSHSWPWPVSSDSI